MLSQGCRPLALFHVSHVVTPDSVDPWILPRGTESCNRNLPESPEVRGGWCLNITEALSVAGHPSGHLAGRCGTRSLRSRQPKTRPATGAAASSAPARLSDPRGRGMPAAALTGLRTGVSCQSRGGWPARVQGRCAAFDRACSRRKWRAGQGASLRLFRRCRARPPKVLPRLSYPPTLSMRCPGEFNHLSRLPCATPVACIPLRRGTGLRVAPRRGHQVVKLKGSGPAAAFSNSAAPMRWRCPCGRGGRSRTCNVGATGLSPVPQQHTAASALRHPALSSLPAGESNPARPHTS